MNIGPNTSRSEHAKKNLVSGTVNKVISLLLPFIVRTLLIEKLGIEYLGLSSLFSSILQVLNLADLGFSNAIVYALYKPVANNDVKSICSLMFYIRRIYRIIGTTILLSGLMLTPFLYMLINGEPPEHVNLYAIYIIYLANTSLSYFIFAYKQTLPTAMQQMDVVNYAGTASSIFMNVTQIILLLTTGSYYLYLLIMPISTIINNLIISHFVNVTYPDIRPSEMIGPEERRRIKGNVVGLMVNKICGITRNSFDSIFISMFIGLSACAIYNNYFTVMMAVLGIAGILSSSILPSVGNSIAIEDSTKNYLDLRRLNFVYMWFSGWCSICMLCLFQPFMYLWVGRELTFPDGVVFLLVAYFYVLKMGDIRSLYSDGAGLWWENRYRAIGEAASNLILNYISVQLWGIYGVIASTLISLLVINFGLGSQIVFKYYFKNNLLKEYFSDHLMYLIVTVFISVVTYIICGYIMLDNIYGLVLKFIICLTLPNVLYYLLYRHSSQYSISMPWIIERLGLSERLIFLLPRNKS